MRVDISEYEFLFCVSFSMKLVGKLLEIDSACGFQQVIRPYELEFAQLQN